MKLKNKLFINFGILFFLTINIFAFFIIESNFSKTLKNMVNASLGEYSVIYNTIKAGEELNNLFLTDIDIIKIKSDSYLNNISNPNISFEFRDKDRKPVYSSNDRFLDLPTNIFNLIDSKNNYMILNESTNKLLLITNLISINDTEYTFTYIRDINFLYQDKMSDFMSLLTINIIVGILLLIIIYIIAVDITKPLILLINSMDEVIHGNYNKKLSYNNDITELNLISTNFDLMNNEIQNKMTELEEQNNEKQRFIENLTHEIRTPLTSIIGYSKLMLDKNIDDIDLLHSSLSHINKEGNRILSLTSNLINLLTLNKNTLKVHPTSLTSILKEIELSFSIKLKENNITLNIIGNDILLNTDRDLINILLSNLVDNSIKSFKDTSNNEINLILQDNSLEINDTGIGISDDDLKKIFEPFYMVDKSRQGSLNGFGLGLSICNTIIKILNIDFQIKSQLEVGTTIILTFNKEDIL